MGRLASPKRVLLVVICITVVMAGPLAAQDLVILHTNDIHGRIETDLETSEPRLGMPLIAAIIEDYRDRYDNVLVLDAGDTIHGRPITNRLEGRSTVETMNVAGYDLMVPGNHDFNFGYERLLELEDKMEFDLIAANVYKDGELLFKPYVIKEAGDFRVGFFGLATPDTYSTTHPNNIVGIEFGDMVEAAETYVGVLRDEGVDLIVALGHVGFGRNYPSTAVVEQVEGIDLFVDGHSHDRLPQGERHHGTLFVQAYEYSKDIGVVYIDLQGDEPEFDARLISAADAGEIPPHEDIHAMLKEFREEVRALMLGL